VVVPGSVLEGEAVPGTVADPGIVQVEGVVPVLADTVEDSHLEVLCFVPALWIPEQV